MTDPVAHIKVNVRCPECRRTFHERVTRIAQGAPVSCPSCGCEMRFHDIGHLHAHEDVDHYIRHVEERTRHPHYRPSDR